MTTQVTAYEHVPSTSTPNANSQVDLPYIQLIAVPDKLQEQEQDIKIDCLSLNNEHVAMKCADQDTKIGQLTHTNEEQDLKIDSLSRNNESLNIKCADQETKIGQLIHKNWEQDLKIGCMSYDNMRLTTKCADQEIKIEEQDLIIKEHDVKIREQDVKIANLITSVDNLLFDKREARVLAIIQDCNEEFDLHIDPPLNGDVDQIRKDHNGECHYLLDRDTTDLRMYKLGKIMTFLDNLDEDFKMAFEIHHECGDGMIDQLIPIIRCAIDRIYPILSSFDGCHLTRQQKRKADRWLDI